MVLQVELTDDEIVKAIKHWVASGLGVAVEAVTVERDDSFDPPYRIEVTRDGMLNASKPT